MFENILPYESIHTNVMLFKNMKGMFDCVINFQRCHNASFLMWSKLRRESNKIMQFGLRLTNERNERPEWLAYCRQKYKGLQTSMEHLPHRTESRFHTKEGNDYVRGIGRGLQLFLLCEDKNHLNSKILVTEAGILCVKLMAGVSRQSLW